jgi:hypothetical protein
MDSSQSNDTYVICFAAPSNLWVAFSTKTRQIGMAPAAREALIEGIEAADHEVAESAREREGTHGNKSSHELILALAKIAQPMTEEECKPGVVYKYERASSSIFPAA